MASPGSFLALYTKNTTKKARTWLDGTITATPAGSNRVRVVLKTANGVEIETDFVKLCVEGEELKLERHLVQVLEPKGPRSPSRGSTASATPASATTSGKRRSAWRVGAARSRTATSDRCKKKRKKRREEEFFFTLICFVCA